MSNNFSQEDPLHYAIWNDNHTDAFTLVEGGYDVNSKTSNGTTPLVVAIEKQNIYMINYLIIKGADPNLRFQKQFTPLIYSASQNYLEIVNILIQAKANVDDSIPFWGLTSLLIAIKNNNFDVVKTLIENGGADINKKDEEGSPLLLAVTRGHEQIVLYLLEKGVNIDKDEPYMLRALEGGSNTIIQALMKAGLSSSIF